MFRFPKKGQNKGIAEPRVRKGPKKRKAAARVLLTAGVARLKGFEPPASSLGGKHSIQLSYKRGYTAAYPGNSEKTAILLPIHTTTKPLCCQYKRCFQPVRALYFRFAAGRSGAPPRGYNKRKNYRGQTVQKAKMRFAFQTKRAILITVYRQGEKIPGETGGGREIFCLFGARGRNFAP